MIPRGKMSLELGQLIQNLILRKIEVIDDSVTPSKTVKGFDPLCHEAAEVIRKLISGREFWIDPSSGSIRKTPREGMIHVREVI